LKKEAVSFDFSDKMGVVKSPTYPRRKGDLDEILGDCCGGVKQNSTAAADGEAGGGEGGIGGGASLWNESSDGSEVARSV
jgi:hypothetical protein